MSDPVYAIPRRPDTLTHAEAVALISELLMAREGATIDLQLALERARNIVAALGGLTVES